MYQQQQLLSRLLFLNLLPAQDWSVGILLREECVTPTLLLLFFLKSPPRNSGGDRSPFPMLLLLSPSLIDSILHLLMSMHCHAAAAECRISSMQCAASEIIIIDISAIKSRFSISSSAFFFAFVPIWLFFSSPGRKRWWLAAIVPIYCSEITYYVRSLTLNGGQRRHGAADNVVLDMTANAECELFPIPLDWEWAAASSWPLPTTRCQCRYHSEFWHFNGWKIDFSSPRISIWRDFRRREKYNLSRFFTKIHYTDGYEAMYDAIDLYYQPLEESSCRGVSRIRRRPLPFISTAFIKMWKRSN